jgi:hypothetical protein
MSQEKNTIEEYDAILKEVRGLMVAKKRTSKGFRRHCV